MIFIDIESHISLNLPKSVFSESQFSLQQHKNPSIFDLWLFGFLALKTDLDISLQGRFFYLAGRVFTTVGLEDFMVSEIDGGYRALLKWAPELTAEIKFHVWVGTILFLLLQIGRCVLIFLTVGGLKFVLKERGKITLLSKEMIELATKVLFFIFIFMVE